MKISKIKKETLYIILDEAIDQELTIDEFCLKLKENVEKDNFDELLLKRKETSDSNEYQKLTYQLTKLHKPKIDILDLGEDFQIEIIDPKTLYINIFKYSKIPAQEIQANFEKIFYFDGNFFHFDNVLENLSKACVKIYSKNELRKLIIETEFDLFETPANFMKKINVSSTKSLKIRIDRFNEFDVLPIVPFEFLIGDNLKTLYLKNDVERLLNFLKK